MKCKYYLLALKKWEESVRSLSGECLSKHQRCDSRSLEEMSHDKSSINTSGAFSMSQYQILYMQMYCFT